MPVMPFLVAPARSRRCAAQVRHTAGPMDSPPRAPGSNAAPSGSTPGDALRACDNNADGYGVTAKLLNSNYDILRTATTSGLSAGHCSIWKTGNLPEGNRYLIITNRTKGGDELTLDHGFVSS